MKVELHTLLSQAKTPYALSEALYHQCFSVEDGVQKIDFLCSRRAGNLEMTCFIEVQSRNAAHKLANRLEARIFGDKCVFFEVPLASEFVCEGFSLKDGGGGLPIPLSCKCSW